MFSFVLFCDEICSVMKFGSIMKRCLAMKLYAVQFRLEVLVCDRMFNEVLFVDDVQF